MGLIRSLTILMALGAGALVAAAVAGDATSGFAKGNELYATGNYQEAIERYEQEVARGGFSANLFYNLGNACFRAGDSGRAILHYERALVLDPKHAEARANLEFVRDQTVAQRPNPGWPQKMLGVVSVDSCIVIAAIAAWTSLFCLALRRFVRRGRNALLGIAVAAALVLAAAIAPVVQSEGGAKNPARAVVLAKEAPARFGPADNEKAVSRLPAGSEVRILFDRGNWIFSLLPDNTLGWIASHELARIRPAVAD